MARRIFSAGGSWCASCCSATRQSLYSRRPNSVPCDFNLAISVLLLRPVQSACARLDGKQAEPAYFQKVCEETICRDIGSRKGRCHPGKATRTAQEVWSGTISPQLEMCGWPRFTLSFGTVLQGIPDGDDPLAPQPARDHAPDMASRLHQRDRTGLARGGDRRN